jgi:polyferredoxin
LPHWISRCLALLPFLLLVWVVIVAMQHRAFNLAAIEPFDAYVVRVAGWATLAVAAGGLLVSLFVPMAYCRFGCPTGAMLNYVRLQGPGDRFGRRDIAAVALLALAIGLRLVLTTA